MRSESMSSECVVSSLRPFFSTFELLPVLQSNNAIPVLAWDLEEGGKAVMALILVCEARRNTSCTFLSGHSR
jgi:hypothetical protein